ncbi:hypothetical protein [Methanobrevibacter sp.]|nr:zinc-ribbon domain-containing protein [Methanobrevibacter sp.]
MNTCPNCGSIVMRGEPYCSHCGAHFRWDETSKSQKRRVTVQSGFLYMK